jgi:hypoxanthine phosphoribosyltransferase
MAEMVRIQDKLFVPYINEEKISGRISELGAQINRDYASTNPLMIVVLNGAFMFAADLVRQMTVRPEIQFVRISTYGDSMSSSKNAQTFLQLDVDMEGRDIILVEDIIETGYTARFLIESIGIQNPNSIRMVSLLFKPSEVEDGYKPDYVGFEIPPAFVIGYGLDYAQQGRELKGLYQLKEE